VLAAAEQWRRRIERQPVRFMRRELPGLVRAAAGEVAAFIAADPDDVVFVDNATTGTNVVLQSLRLDPGDEVLTTTHAYGAVGKTIEYVCHRTGARMVQAPIPLPVTDEAQIATAITTRFTSRTKLLVIDHVASPTALIFPVKTLTAFAHAHGVRVLVDGAHAPGMLDLDVREATIRLPVTGCATPEHALLLHDWLWGGSHRTVRR
jgi:isopenicillin-N epimerase